MAVNNDTMKASYAGDDSSTELAFTWTIYEDDDILVIDEVDATGVQSTLTLNSDYSVTIDSSGGGTVVLESASVSGHTYYLICNIDNLQELEFTEGDKFPVDSVETALDKLTMQVIQLKDATDRSIKIPITEDTDQTLDDVAANRANKAVIFDAAGKVTIGTDDYEDQATNSAASAAAALASQISAAASEAAATIAATKLKGTSTTSLAIGTGSKTFATQASKQFDVGVWLLITSDADETNYMHGQVTAYSGTSLAVNVTNVGGSGTLADWTITVAGTQGATGATGATGTVAVVAAGGTVDAITADYTPDLVLANEPFVAFVSAGANTSATPTFAPDGLTAHTIVKEGGVALVAGDIGAAGYVAIVKYDLANTRWELLNPCKPTTAGNANTVDSYHIDETSAVDNELTIFDVTNKKLKRHPGLIASYENLKIINNTTHPTYQLDITADKVQFINGMVVSSFSKTVDMTASGANGLDTGSEGASTWYHIWAIAKTDGTNASLLSASATAPTMPSGYTLKTYLGTVYNDGGSDFIVFYQLDKKVACAEAVVLSNGTSTTWASISLATVVPTTAKKVDGYAQEKTASMRIFRISGQAAYTGNQWNRFYSVDTNGTGGYWRVYIVESQTIYYLVDSSTGSLYIVVTGWEF